MPIQLPSLTGKVDPVVERLLRYLVTAVNALEENIGGASREAELAAEVAQLHAQIQQLQGQIGAGAGTLVIDPNGALGGAGTATSPLTVRVDGSSVLINAGNQLEAP
jgi:hypothetical protein